MGDILQREDGDVLLSCLLDADCILLLLFYFLFFFLAFVCFNVLENSSLLRLICTLFLPRPIYKQKVISQLADLFCLLALFSLGL